MTPTAEVARVLEERARQLANVDDVDSASPQSLLEVLLCRVGTERYALDMSDLRSVHRPSGLTAVPCEFGQVAGVVNIRGELVTVLDLAALLDLGATTVESATRVLLVETTHGAVGLLIDEVLGVEQLALEQLDPPPPGPASSRGIANGSTVLLNLEQLFAEQGFDEENEVGR